MRMRQSPSVHVQLPIGGANVMRRKAGSAHICVETPDYLAPIQNITKGNIMGKGTGFVIVVVVIINYNWIHQLINLYSLTTTPQSEYCKDQRR